MIFDKNQKEFLSETHKAIWDAGTHIIPIEVTIPHEINDKLPPYLIESCFQFYKYILHLLSDIYENPDVYEPFQFQDRRISIQYKFIVPFADFGLVGEAGEDFLIINRSVFDKLFLKQIKSKTYQKDSKTIISLEQRIRILERTGLKISYKGNDAILKNILFPNIFYAIREMAQVSSDEKGSGDNSFTYCDFRKLCKDYKYDKFENALVFLNDEDKSIARELDSIAKKYKLTRSIKSGYCPGYEVIYKYKNAVVMDFNGLNSRLTMSVRFRCDIKNTEPINRLFDEVEKDSNELKEFIYKKLHRCTRCYQGCHGYANMGWAMSIYGKTNRMCVYTDRMGIRLPTGAKNSYAKLDDMSLIEKTLFHAKKLVDEM
jgi:hypothetical protein